MPKDNREVIRGLSVVGEDGKQKTYIDVDEISANFTQEELDGFITREILSGNWTSAKLSAALEIGDASTGSQTSEPPSESATGYKQSDLEKENKPNLLGIVDELNTKGFSIEVAQADTKATIIQAIMSAEGNKQ
ncbi:MAG TPA: hypothetical protein VGC76_14540 [Pyrinomonadaceae bacterium]|jgi:hypothetical protein